jgi:hypothetical protein
MRSSFVPTRHASKADIAIAVVVGEVEITFDEPTERPDDSKI